MDRNFKVSVIVPVYGVEKFVGHCIDSLMRQTLDCIEYIIVDDCTPDSSMDIIKSVVESYPNRKDCVKYIKHNINRGLPSARNTGLQAATGKYVFHCDSDDFVEPDMLEQLYNKAEKEQADIVWCDWYLTFKKNERYMKQPSFNTWDEALKGVLTGKMKYNVWNKLAKRELYINNGIVFPDGHGMGEDMTMIRLMACAKKVAYVPKAFYHYIKTNAGAFTNQYSDKQKTDMIHNTSETCEFIEKRFPNELEEELACFKLNVKYPFLIGADKKNYDLWRSYFRETDAFIGSKQMGLRSRLLQKAALHHFDIFLKLHYWLIYKVIYGILYR